ncbi:8-oxoguanine glycosylase ogg1 [Phytophthora boehmeriae]|uniref:8-oxoguanine glycosylase ogg1 n=1 Tax=Phytophthora boehmeriae TaxID=109152 RepID=A0A8T1WLJ7_9STRA|nr:8-oxoguanine glycosylase ogg1 [Phytophthora boehmeriae]
MASSAGGACTAITHTGARCTSAATSSSGQCAHHTRMARVMALAPKTSPPKASPPPSPSPSGLFAPPSSSTAPSLSPSSSSSSFDFSPMNSALNSATSSSLLPAETVVTTVSCAFVFPAALNLPDIPGTLSITSFRLRFEPQSTSLRTSGDFHRLLDVAIQGMPRAALARLSYPQATATASRSLNAYASGNSSGLLTPSRLVIKFKNLRSWTLGGDVHRLLPALNRFAYVDSPLSLFAFTSMGATQDDLQAHALYDVYEDFARMGVALRDGSSAYRVTELNAAFAMCPTYPRQLVVPAAASDSEPKRGILHAQNSSDEQYLLHIARAASGPTSSYPGPPTRKIWIADCRPELNARVNNLTGGGTESGNLAHARVTFLNIGNIHAMRESIEAVRALGGFTATTTNTESMDLAWGSRVEDTKWLSHLCGLAQLLVDSRYRTRRGLIEIIEKEWVRAGHKFQDRVAPGKAEDDDDQQAPIFLQFLDCIWQLTRIFPTYFEFNELTHAQYCLILKLSCAK